MRGHKGYVMDADFSPDGEFVVSVSLDGTARIWRADGAGIPAVLRGHDRGIVDVAFSPDGTHVVTASRDGTARIWRVGWTELLEHLGRSTRACLTPEQRMWFLAEIQAEAAAAFAKCEHEYGRKPDPNLSIGKHD